MVTASRTLKQKEDQMVQENNSIIAEVNKIKIGFTDKEITAYGGYSLLAKFFDKIELRQNISHILPIQERSPNSTGVYAKIIALTLIVFSGGNRFSHLLYLGSKRSLERLFGIKHLSAAATTLTRLFNKIRGLSLAEKFSAHVWDYTNRLFPWQNIQQDWLGFDSTVIERYGNQEGSKKGYNPKKHGRPCHHPLIAFLNKSGYVVNLWNRCGNVQSGNNICAFFKAL